MAAAAITGLVLGLPEGLAQPTAGDPLRGKQLAVECFACHGADGNSPSPVNPKIGGQHEDYLFLALKAYLNGSRSDSLMRGAVLNKSEQDLRDIAAYYARQSGDLGAAGSRTGSAPADGRAGSGDVMRFDHGARTAAFTSMAARAHWLAARAAPVGAAACGILDEAAAAEQDADGDGLADRYDAAPADAAEFVADTNGDGRFEICSIQQLDAIARLGREPGQATPLGAELRRGRSYQLVRDLDAAALTDLQPIGDCGPTGNCMRALGQFGFAGVFDGQGHVIRNVNIARPDSGGVGLFGVLAEVGVVMNLHLEGVQVTGRAGTGALVGSNFGVVFNSSAQGSVTGALAIGGLVGGSGGLVYAGRFSGSVAGQQAVGGLVGDMTGAVYYSQAAAHVDGQRGIGGLVGLNTFGSVLGSSASGAVTGSDDVGGLVGVNTDARIRQSFATGPVTGDGNNIGGLVGFNSLSTVRNSYALGAVAGADGVGGLAGRNNGRIDNSYAAGRVRGAGLAGGIVGIVVEGWQNRTYTTLDNDAPYGGKRVDLAALTGESTGWAPARLPAVDLLDFFCDNNRNGFIDPDEQRVDNYIWQFAGNTHPRMRCAAGL